MDETWGCKLVSCLIFQQRLYNSYSIKNKYRVGDIAQCENACLECLGIQHPINKQTNRQTNNNQPSLLLITHYFFVFYIYVYVVYMYVCVLCSCPVLTEVRKIFRSLGTKDRLAESHHSVAGNLTQVQQRLLTANHFCSLNIFFFFFLRVLSCSLVSP